MRKISTLLLAFIISCTCMKAATIIVTINSGGEEEGTIRYAFSNANDGDIIEFNIPGEDVIVLDGTLSRTKAGTTVTVNGMNKSTGNPVTLDASGDKSFYRAGSQYSSVNINFNNLVFANALNTSNGGALAFGNSAMTARAKINITNCTFDNCSGGSGGAIGYNQWTDLVVENCTFTGNKATTNGGAAASLSSANLSARFTNCTFYQNQATSGGALYCHAAATDGVGTLVTNCTFVENMASGSGGGVFADANGQTMLTNCIAGGNSSNDVFGKRINLKSCIVEKTDASVEAAKIIDEIPYSASIFKGGAASLESNGGPTKTIAIDSNGKAFKMGASVAEGITIPATDQRGAPRLSPPSVGAYDNPDYVFTGLSTISKSELTIEVINSQVIISAEKTGIAMIYNTAGVMIGKTVINGNTVLPVSFVQGVYIIRFVESATGVTCTEKILIK